MDIHHYKVGAESIYIKTHDGESFYIPRNTEHIDDLAQILGENPPRIIALLEEIVMRLKYRQEKNYEHHEKLFRNWLSKSENRAHKEKQLNGNKEWLGESLQTAFQRIFGISSRKKDKGKEYHRQSRKPISRDDLKAYANYLSNLETTCLGENHNQKLTNQDRNMVAQHKRNTPILKDKKTQALWEDEARLRRLKTNDNKKNQKRRKEIIKQYKETQNIRTGARAAFLKQTPMKNNHGTKKFIVQAVLQFVKMIDAQQGGKLRLLAASSNPNQEQGIEVKRDEIISKQWVRDNINNLSTLFLAFQRLVFDRDDPREFDQLTKDEQNILQQNLLSKLEYLSEDTQEEADPTMALSTNISQEIKTLGLQEELAKLFGAGETIDRWYSQRRADADWDWESGEKKSSGLTPEEETMKEIGFNIYKKLLALSLYHQGKLHIRTANGKETFKDPIQAETSIDGMVYYEDHQERYAGDNFYKFIYSEDRGKEGVFIAVTDLKIDDFRFDALEKTFQPLGKLNIAPLFYMIVTDSLFPSKKTQNPGDALEA